MKHADDDMDDLKHLYAQAPGEEPPAALDAAILAQARSAVQASAPRSSATRWRAPLATAAVLVLSVIVVLNVQREQPEVLSVAGPAPQPPMSLQGQAGKATEAPAAPAAAALIVAPTTTPAIAPAISGAAEARAPSAFQPSAELQRGTGEASSTMNEPVAAGPRLVPEPVSPSASQPPSQPAARPAAPASQGASRLSLRADNARSEIGAVSAAATAAKSTADMTAEQWLAHLVELRAQGRQQEFQDSLAEFRKRHPGHRIPEALLGTLPSGQGVVQER